MSQTQTQHNYNSSSPYISTATVFLNYEKMVKNFKVFMYKPNNPQIKFATTNSTYLTQDPEEAHLFFDPFSPDFSTRVLTRIRNDLPYWNRTLGADHLYLSCDGIPLQPDRNLVELKKNAVQISCFPTQGRHAAPAP
ncbi:hypothetical protein D0Y65_005026 [Glycine soja]|uniref:Exostosin GT47 domain-containing protein n=2 Tax=Glycine subgen. Soja TaxID=1462606 RepID=K7KAN3_SOYBN|nr:hypothetical protein D0Y65_005026 [Glycine soja]